MHPDIPADISQFVPEIILASSAEVRAFADQPRTYFDPGGLVELAESIKIEGQLTPALAIRLVPPIGPYKYELIDGERRWRACELKGIKHFLILINPRIMSKNDQYVQSVVANFFREPPTDVESAKSIDRLKSMGMPNETIAKRMGKSITWVYQHYSLLRLHPDVLKLIDPPTPKEKRIPYLNALAIVDLSHEEQQRLAAEMSQGKLTRKQTKLLVRKSAERQGITQKLKLPKKAFRAMRRFVIRTNTEIEDIHDQPEGFFDQVIKGAKTSELDLMLRDMGDMVSGFKLLVEEISKRRYPDNQEKPTG